MGERSGVEWSGVKKRRDRNGGGGGIKLVAKWGRGVEWSGVE
jgi:hypothetical protein